MMAFISARVSDRGDCRKVFHLAVHKNKSHRSYLFQTTVFLSLILFVHTGFALKSSPARSPTKQRNVVSEDTVDFNGKGKLKYVWGDALADPKATGPDGKAYPW